MDTIILYTLIVFQLSKVEGHPHKTTHYDVPENRIDYLNGEGQHTYRDLPEDHVKVVCEAVQVKEKFGGLCFYIYGDDDDFINGAIVGFATSSSFDA